MGSICRLRLTAIAASPPGHCTCYQASSWAMSCLVIYEIARSNSELICELGKSQVGDFQAGAEDSKDLPLVVLDRTRGQLSLRSNFVVGNSVFEKCKCLLKSV